MKRILLILCLLFLTGTLSAEIARASDVAVIVNKDNNNSIDRNLLKKIYLGYSARWQSGGAIVALELPEDSPQSAIFVTKALSMTQQAVKDIWAQNVFTGKALPPSVLNSDDEIKKTVAKNRRAIGYISNAAVDSSVKVVLTLQ